MLGLFTARIRRMRKVVVFSLSVHTLMRGGEYLHPKTDGGGYHIPGQARGTPHLRSGQEGTPSQVRMGGTPSQVRTGGSPCQQDEGTPHWQDGVTPHPGPRSGQGHPNWSSIVCTCYASGGMPFAFTQEDFLVAS